MRKMFRTFALLLASLLTVPMLTGCGGDDGDSEERVASANFVTATPPAGSTIIPNGSIILTLKLSIAMGGSRSYSVKI